MRRRLAVVLVFGSLYAQLSQLVAQVPQANSSEPLLGFTAASSTQERQWEEKFKTIPEPQRMRDSMQRLSASPHHVGSPYDKTMRSGFSRNFSPGVGIPKIEQFDVLFPTPKMRLLEMTAPTPFKAKLEEPTLAVDPTSGQKDRAASDLQRLLA